MNAKVVLCCCGLLRFEEEPCLLCEGDDDEAQTPDEWLMDGLRTMAGDEDDVQRKQLEARIAMDSRRH